MRKMGEDITTNRRSQHHSFFVATAKRTVDRQSEWRKAKSHILHWPGIIHVEHEDSCGRPLDWEDGIHSAFAKLRFTTYILSSSPSEQIMRSGGS
jgi:hypothetical protein